ncbi:citrate lyase subunit beta / citryl-CoA lyase [Desulfurobacterium pacificum]|uniref:Citrate lyase subunit beta / citryl-CoA lyase n=1 Tax=Desulfurobacterium pacificum TaxID=240166 RepID=A0ABY1NL72_9BACT|nr:CoA ester lyase [Desulfurobacterium pacificum]SMP12626.1 citrate lyase subunit beta / citryl-CoA lyase [Desulfurobacterium pacificum]
MELDKLFELAERFLEGIIPLEEIEKFPESSPERVPFKGVFRRSALLISGDRPRHLRKAFLRPADVLIFNLEDGVAEKSKAFARILLRKFLLNVPFDGLKEVVIRINPLDSEYSWEDMFLIFPTIPHAVRLSKVKSYRDVVALDGALTAFEKAHGLPSGTVKIHLSIETASAIESLEKILTSSPRVTVAYLGILDLFADLDISQDRIYPSSPLSVHVKSKFALTCRSLRVVPIAPAYQNHEDLKGFEKEALEDRELGFEGKMCISVRQVEIANKVFSPSQEEIEEAKEIVRLYEEALKEGKGGITYKGRFIDQPIYRDALNKLKALED